MNSPKKNKRKADSEWYKLFVQSRQENLSSLPSPYRALQANKLKKPLDNIVSAKWKGRVPHGDTSPISTPLWKTPKVDTDTPSKCFQARVVSPTTRSVSCCGAHANTNLCDHLDVQVSTLHPAEQSASYNRPLELSLPKKQDIRLFDEHQLDNSSFELLLDDFNDPALSPVDPKSSLHLSLGSDTSPQHHIAHKSEAWPFVREE